MKQSQTILILPDSAPSYFYCDSRHCDSIGKLCCRSYNIEIYPDEAKLIVNILPKIKEFLNNNPFETDDQFFEEIDDNTIGIPDSSEGCCPFLTRDRNERPSCAIHLAAESLGLEVTQYKPIACRLFPLDLIYLDEKTISLQLHPDYSSLPCLSNESHSRSFSLLQLAEAATGTKVEIHSTNPR